MPGVEWGRLEKTNRVCKLYQISKLQLIQVHDIYGYLWQCVSFFHRESDDWGLGWYPMFSKKHILMVRFDVQSLCTWDDDDYYYCCYCYGEYY